LLALDNLLKLFVKHIGFSGHHLGIAVDVAACFGALTLSKDIIPQR
jgi:sialic acid synthase SpsE